MLIVLIGLNSQDQGKSNWSSDRTRDWDHWKLLECDRPFLGNEFEYKRDEEDGSRSWDEADQYLKKKERNREYLIVKVKDYRYSKIDEDYSLRNERNELEENSKWHNSYEVACIPPGERL